MENTNDTEPVGLTNSEIPKEIQDALDMPDQEYIKLLEDHIINLIEANRFGREALETFTDLLEFIGENFGDTSDFPIRIDSDFYEGLFVEKLKACQEAVEDFFEKFEESDVEEGELQEGDEF